jgi:hypothetical protein
MDAGSLLVLAVAVVLLLVWLVFGQCRPGPASRRPPCTAGPARQRSAAARADRTGRRPERGRPGRKHAVAPGPTTSARYTPSGTWASTIGTPTGHPRARFSLACRDRGGGQRSRPLNISSSRRCCAPSAAARARRWSGGSSATSRAVATADSADRSTVFARLLNSSRSSRWARRTISRESRPRWKETSSTYRRSSVFACAWRCCLLRCQPRSLSASGRPTSPREGRVRSQRRVSACRHRRRPERPFRTGARRRPTRPRPRPGRLYYRTTTTGNPLLTFLPVRANGTC